MKEKRKEYFKLNKNIFIAFVADIIVSATVAQQLVEQHHHLNTTFTLAADYATFFSVLGFLLYLDNRKKYRLDSGETNWVFLKKDMVKMISSLGMAEIVYTAARWLTQYYFLTIEYDPYLASITGQVISIGVYTATLNTAVRISKLFKDEK